MIKKILFIFLVFLGGYLFHLKTYKVDPIVIAIEKQSPVKHHYKGIFDITFYVATGNKTSTGTIPQQDRTIAVDPKVIPYGTIVYIEGIGARIAEDCGGTVKNNVIDVFVDTSREKALQMGRHKRKVYILD